MLGYRSTPAGLRLLRHRTSGPAGVMGGSSSGPRLPYGDMERRVHRTHRVRGGRRSAALRARPSVVQVSCGLPYQPGIVHTPFRRRSVIALI